jgi:ubiquinone/menaquinone biosynthesis C-methylase UbiE
MNSSKRMHAQYYVDNEKYSAFLESHDIASYSKYLKWLKPHAGEKVLDIGCGVGKVVDLLCREGFEGYGADISKSSLQKASSDRLGKYSWLNSKALPFSDNFFDSVGAFTVLEHVEDPAHFIGEMVRVTRKGGKLVLVCPNFLGLTNSYHWHTRGILRKIKNFFISLKKGLYFLFAPHRLHFDTMEPRIKQHIEPDDDAIIVTNPMDVLNELKKFRIERIYYSSMVYDCGEGMLQKVRDLPLLKYFFGGVFFVGIKE